MASEIDKAVSILDSLAGEHDSQPEQAAALRFAIRALYFIHNTGQTQLFDEHLKTYSQTPPRRATHSFSTMQEAESWLQQQSPGAVLGSMVKVGETTFSVRRDPTRLMLVRTVAPDDLK
jgi:hypothetical protein